MFPIYDKVLAGGAGGVVSTIVVSVLAAFGVVLPPVAVSLIVVAVMFTASYLKTETKIGKQVEDVWKAMESEGPVQP